MTALETILSKITGTAKQQADEQIDEVKKQALLLHEQAQAEAEAHVRTILAKAQQECAQIAARGQSSAQFQTRNRMLKFKQVYIEGVTEEALQELENQSDTKYAETLLTLLQRYARPESGKMLLSKRSLSRLPKDFAVQAEAAAGAAIAISSSPADIGGGFLLMYHGIDVNCTFAALFAERQEDLRDIAGSLLFSE